MIQVVLVVYSNVNEKNIVETFTATVGFVGMDCSERRHSLSLITYDGQEG